MGYYKDALNQMENQPSYDNPAENVPHYNRLADTYDLLQKAQGFNDPQELLKAIWENEKIYQRTWKVLDLGCGTGLMGKELSDAGI